METHRDAYNQALGGLQLLDHLEGEGRDYITEGEFENLVNARIQSIDPVAEDVKNSD